LIVLDTTVLVYTQGSEHPLREPCRRLIRAISLGAVQATTTVEVIQEFLHVRARRRDRLPAVADARAYAQLLAPLLTADDAVLRNGLILYGSTFRLGAFDAVLAAAAVAAGAEALVSADSAFGEVPGLRHVVPTDPGVASLL
jgi:predicted nucleic acid-binding protein